LAKHPFGHHPQTALAQAGVACATPDTTTDVLAEAQRLSIDIIRMIAYRADTRMVPAVAAAQGKNPMRE